MKKLFILLFVLVGCTAEEPDLFDEVLIQNTIEDITTGIFKDLDHLEDRVITQVRTQFYEGNFDTLNYYAYYNFFRLEAKIHGIDLSHLDKHEVIIEDRTHVNKDWVAWAKARDNDELVHIGVNRELFFHPQRTTRARIFIMFHELGHDALNLEHKTPTAGDCRRLTSIMNPCGMADINFYKLSTLTRSMFIWEYQFNKL